MQRILLALGVKNFEAALKTRMNNDEYIIVGEAIYKEAIFKAIKETAPNIIILRESLPGNTDILELITDIRRKHNQIRIIFIASSERKPGDPLLAYIASYGIYDILQGDILIDSLIDLIKHPHTIADAYIYMPDAKFDSNKDVPVFKTKEILVPEQEIEDAKRRKIKKTNNNYSGVQYYSPELLNENNEDEINLNFTENTEQLGEDILDLPTDDDFEFNFKDDELDDEEFDISLDEDEENDDLELLIDDEIEDDIEAEFDMEFDIDSDENDNQINNIDIVDDDEFEDIEEDNDEEISIEDDDINDEYEIDNDSEEYIDSDFDLDVEVENEKDVDKENIEIEPDIEPDIKIDDEQYEADDKKYLSENNVSDDIDAEFDLDDEENIEENIDIDIDEKDIDINMQDSDDKFDISDIDNEQIFNPYEEMSRSELSKKRTDLKSIKTFENSKETLNNMVVGGMDEGPLDELDYQLGMDKFQQVPVKPKLQAPTIEPIPIPVPIMQVPNNNQDDKYSRKKSPFGKRMLNKNKNLEKASGEARNGRPAERTISKQKIITFIAPKIGVGNSHIAFSTAMKIATTGAKVLFIETSEDGATLDYLYELGDNRGLDRILAGTNNFSDDTILKNIVSIPDKKNSFFNDTSNSNLIGKKAIGYFPDTFNYLLFSDKFRNDSINNPQQYNADKFLEMITLLLSQYNYEYIIIDTDFNIENKLLPYILKYSSQIYITISQDIEIINRYLNNLKPYLDLKVGKNVNRYFLLNKEEKSSFTSNQISTQLIEEPILASLPYLGEIFTESNYQGIPVIMNNNERIQEFFDVIARACIAK